MNETRVPCEACVSCGGNDVLLDCRISLRGKMDVDVTVCRGCGLLFVNPMLTTAQIASIYDAGYWDPDPPGQGVLSAYRVYPRHYRFGAAYGRKLAKVTPRGRMLEIGCGLPFFLKGVADNCDWEVEGVDVAEGISTFARDKLGLKVTEVAFGSGLFPAASFDLVRAKDVIEHVPRPMEFLAAVHEVLKSGGRVELWLPNGPLDLAAARTAYRRGTRVTMGAGHILFIAPRVLRGMLLRSGFTIQDHRVSGLRYAAKALGLPKAPPRALDSPAPAAHAAPSLAAWEQPAPERGLKGSGFYTAYREWRSHNPSLPSWLPFGFWQRVIAQKSWKRLPVMSAG
jgi:SAM-dependent methyltransferase